MSVQDNEEVNVLWGQCVAHLLENKEIKGRKRGSIRLAQPQGLYGNTLIIAVPTEMARKTFQEDLSKQFKEALHSVFGPGVTEAFVIDEDLTIDHDAVSPAPTAAAEPVPAQPSSTAAPEQAEAAEESPLPPLEELEAEARHAAEPASFSAVAGSPEQPTSLSVPDRSEVVDFPSPQHSPSSGAAHHIPEKASSENQAPSWDSSARLNDKYVFDTFVIGQSNRFAHAAALAVAENPASAYNPLFIYGDSGLGKTHLLHAIGHYATKFYPGHRVRYVNSEEFTNDFINSIRDDEGTRFKQIYRNVDLLLIDDIQFLAGKEHTQEEFFHTFNTLHNHEKQVVITSDLPPKQLTGFADRLRSRFEWGLITDVQPPELETRIAILRKKAKAENLDAPDEVMEYIATHISTNIRELEGALIRVTAFASLNGQPVDLALTETIMKDLITDEDVVEITPAVILGQTADFFDVTIEDLKSKSRNRTLVTARQIAMYLLRELTEMSLPRIGAEFGGRDHTTVMHAERKIRQLMAERRQIFNQVTDLTNRIKQQQRQQ